MLGIPHGVLLIRVFCFRVWLEHLSKLSRSVVGLLDSQSQQKLDLYDDVVLLYIGVEGVLLEYLIIGSLSRLAEFTCSVHPSPKVLSGSNDIIGNVVENVVKLVVCGIGCEIGVFIVGLYLEKRVALARRSDRLVD